MSYVLVSLPGDEATLAADRLSKYLEERVEPDQPFREECPIHDDVKSAIARTKTGVFFGHNGNNSLRASATGEPWVDGARLGKIAEDARIYVYACSALDDPESSLGAEAVRNGADVVAGHDAWIGSPDREGLTDSQLEILRDAAIAMILAFLGGTNDENELRDAGRKGFNALEKGGLLSVSADGSDFWGVACVQRQLFRSIKVFKKP